MDRLIRLRPWWTRCRRWGTLLPALSDLGRPLELAETWRFVSPNSVGLLVTASATTIRTWTGNPAKTILDLARPQRALGHNDTHIEAIIAIPVVRSEGHSVTYFWRRVCDETESHWSPWYSWTSDREQSIRQYLEAATVLRFEGRRTQQVALVERSGYAYSI